MARLSKFCPRCQGKTLVTVTMIPPATTPAVQVVYKATCKCGFEHPPDSAEVVADARAWAATGAARRLAEGA